MTELTVFAVKYSADQPGGEPGNPLAIDTAASLDEARGVGARHFKVDIDRIQAKLDVDRQGRECFYVSCDERNESTFRP